MKIYITGFMGSGKSTYGKALAQALGYTHLDLDQAIEKKAGRSIAEIFEKEEEIGFRKLEAEVLRETEKLDGNVIISTGGGTPCFHDNMTWMNERGTTVYLKLFEPELSRRLTPEAGSRPLLKGLEGDDLDNYIYNTLRSRAYFYHQAQYVIDPLLLTPDLLAEEWKAPTQAEG